MIVWNDTMVLRQVTALETGYTTRVDGEDGTVYWRVGTQERLEE